MIKRSEVFEKEKQINAEGGSPVTMETPGVTSFIGSNAVWGAIFAGIVMVMVIQLALALLGGGIGLSAANPDNAKALGIGAITWWMLSGLVAFYFGGWTAGRLAGIPSRTDGILHGLVTWGTTTLLMFLFLTSTIGALIGGGFSLLKSGGQAIAQAAPQAAGAIGNVAQQSGLGNPVNDSIRQTLQSRGIPPENLDSISTQLMSELAVLAVQAPETKDAQRQAIANTLVSNTNMNPAEARGMVNQWEQSGQQTKQEIQQGVQGAKEKAQDVAAKASDVAGKGALASFAMLFLTAIAAGLGGFAGTPWPEERM
jgi:hypothetical protein